MVSKERSMNPLAIVFTRTAFETVPGLASLVVTGSAWAAARSSRRAVRWSAGALVLALVAAAGMAYLTRAVDVSSAQALRGALIAALGSAVALSGYYAAGRLIRRAIVVLVLWLAGLVPLYYYAFLLFVLVAAATQCAPGAY